jgi:hypothetical protein
MHDEACIQRPHCEKLTEQLPTSHNYGNSSTVDLTVHGSCATTAAVLVS